MTDPSPGPRFLRPSHLPSRLCATIPPLLFHPSSFFPALPPISDLTAKVRAYELRSKGKEELLDQLDDLKKELQQLRVAKVTAGAANKLAKVRYFIQGPSNSIIYLFTCTVPAIIAQQFVRNGPRSSDGG